MNIKTENLSYIYGQGTPFEIKALDDINIEIASGDFVGIMGYSGSGKSTLITHFNGLLKPTSGRILIDGQDIWEKGYDIKQVRFKVGLVFQYPEYQLFEETVYKDIAFGPSNMGLSSDEVDERVREAAKFTGIGDELLEVSPFELSGGQKRRVAIAGVIAMRPRVLVLDEPTAGLDPEGKETILSQIRKYHEETGASIIFVTHSMEDIARFSNKIIVVNQGKIAMYGTVKEIFDHAAEIRAMGLGVPQVTKVFLNLREKGIDLPTDVYTVAYAKKKIIEYLETHRKGGAGDAI